MDEYATGTRRETRKVYGGIGQVVEGTWQVTRRWRRVSSGMQEFNYICD